MYEINRLDALDYEELISIEQVEIKDVKDRPEADNKLRKAWFFIFAEGIRRTFAKIRSKKSKSLVLSKYKTIIKVSYENKTYINYSIQTSQQKENFVIKNTFFEFNGEVEHSFTNTNIIFNQFSGEETFKKYRKEPIAIPEKGAILARTIMPSNEEGVFLFGLGDYARVYIAPNIKSIKRICCIDYVSVYSNYYKKKYGYQYNSLVPQDCYNNISLVKKPLAIIATYHSDHTRITKEIFEINPNTLFFIEKPPCVTLEDISTLVNLYQKGAKIEIGYNRRYIPINQEFKRKLKGQKAVINISIKEILISSNHWYFWKNQGTRITGNLTHWIDICNFWLEDEIPIELNMLKSTSKDETFSVSILYSNGSLANITVSDKGNSLRGVQEKIEIRTEHEIYFIDDYLKMYFIDQSGKIVFKNKIKRIKGHDEMYKHVVNLFQGKTNFKYTVDDLIKTALTTYHLSEMFKKNIKNFNIRETIISMLDNNKD
jgi:predicted dehydrogenase